MTNQQLYFAIGVPVLVYLLGFTTTILISFWQSRELRGDIRVIQQDLKEFYKQLGQHDTAIIRLKDKTGLDK